MQDDEKSKTVIVLLDTIKRSLRADLELHIMTAQQRSRLKKATRAVEEALIQYREMRGWSKEMPPPMIIASTLTVSSGATTGGTVGVLEIAGVATRLIPALLVATALVLIVSGPNMGEIMTARALDARLKELQLEIARLEHTTTWLATIVKAQEAIVAQKLGVATTLVGILYVTRLRELVLKRFPPPGGCGDDYKEFTKWQKRLASGETRFHILGLLWKKWLTSVLAYIKCFEGQNGPPPATP